MGAGCAAFVAAEVLPNRFRGEATDSRHAEREGAGLKGEINSRTKASFWRVLASAAGRDMSQPSPRVRDSSPSLHDAHVSPPREACLDEMEAMSETRAAIIDI